MTTTMGSNKVQTTLLMPKEMKAKIKAIATAKNASISDVILTLLQIGLSSTHDLELYPVKQKDKT